MGSIGIWRVGNNGFVGGGERMGYSLGVEVRVNANCDIIVLNNWS